MSFYRFFSYFSAFLLLTVASPFSANAGDVWANYYGAPPYHQAPYAETKEGICSLHPPRESDGKACVWSDYYSYCVYEGTGGLCGRPVFVTATGCDYIGTDNNCYPADNPPPGDDCPPLDPSGAAVQCSPPPPCSDYDSCFNWAWDNNPDCQGAESYSFTYADSSNFSLTCGSPSDPLNPVDPALYDPTNDPTDPNSPEAGDGQGGAGGGNNGGDTNPSPGSGSGTPPPPTDPTNDPGAQPIDDSRIIEALNKQLNLLDDRLSSIDRNVAGLDDNINEAINDQTHATVRALNNIGQTLSNPNLGNGQNIENAIKANGRTLDQIEYNTSKTGNILEQMVNTDDLRTVDPNAPGRQLDQPGGSFEGVFDRIGAAPIMQDFSNISALIQVPAATCPPFNVDLSSTLIGANISTTTHCQVFESARSVLETLFSIIWIIVAFRIVAGA